MPRLHAIVWFFKHLILSTIYKILIWRYYYLLRSYSGECLGSSRDEERSELRYSIWIAEFRELIDLWTHAAFWVNIQFAVLPVFTILLPATGHSLFRGSARSLNEIELVRQMLAKLRLLHRILLQRFTAVRKLWLPTVNCASAFIYLGIQTTRFAFAWWCHYFYSNITRFDWSYPLNLSI